jgi:hypothetical protein
VNAPVERTSVGNQLTETLTKELGTDELETKSVDSSDVQQPSPIKSVHSTSTTESPVKGKKRAATSQIKGGKKRSTASGKKISQEVIPEEEGTEEEEEV